MYTERVTWSTVGAVVIASILLTSLMFVLTNGDLETDVALARAPRTGSFFTLTLSGPDAADLWEVITYTAHFTAQSSQGNIWGIEYYAPQGFTVNAVEPITSSMLGPNVLQWDADTLESYKQIVITGSHGLKTHSRAKHEAGFYDVYNADLPSTSKVTAISGISRIYLPIVLSNS